MSSPSETDFGFPTLGLPRSVAHFADAVVRFLFPIFFSVASL